MDFEPLTKVDPKKLRELATALEQDSIDTPLTRDNVASHLSDHQAKLVAQCFKGFEDRADTRNDAAALALRAHAEGLIGATNAAPKIEVVVTGPDDPETARSTSVVTQELFGKIEERVLLVGYVVYQGDEIFRELAERLDLDHSIDAKVCLNIHRDLHDDRKEDIIVQEFAKAFVDHQWPSGKRLPELYYYPRALAKDQSTKRALHAKCLVVDGKEALVTSANFTKAAHERNIELGLLVKSESTAKQIEGHFEALIKTGDLWELPLPEKGSN